MVMISGRVEGEQAKAMLEAKVPRITESVRTAVLGAAVDLRSYVITHKLSGDPLHHRTGNLIDNMMPPQLTETEGHVEAKLYVGSGAPYAHVHEYGDVFSRMISKAWGRDMKNPHEVMFHYPERSFMRSSLEEQKQVILDRIEAAVKAGLE